MNTTRITFTKTTRAMLTLGVALACSVSWAAGRTEVDGESRAQIGARYKVEMAACTKLAEGEDRQACLQDARSAYAEALRGGLSEGLVADPSNAFKRCEPLKEESDRKACVARMQGQGTTSGSVSTGGIYRELVTIVPPAPVPVPVKPMPDVNVQKAP